MFIVSTSTRNNEIFAKLIADSYFFEKNKYEYAFYLIKDGEKKKLYARWYEDSMEARFDMTNFFGTFYIRCFIRDKEIRNIRTFDSEKISIDS